MGNQISRSFCVDSVDFEIRLEESYPECLHISVTKKMTEKWDAINGTELLQVNEGS